MPTIHITTFIQAPVERVFDLSRSIDLHKESMKAFNEKAVAGTRFGLIGKDETVTWTAKHFFKTRVVKVAVTDMEKYSQFTDEQLNGSFKKMKHVHHFKPVENGTIMIDFFDFEIPYGMIGKFFTIIYFKLHLKKMLTLRNKAIREYAESNKWKRFLDN
jgi:ligand-binding SRPBCC domain-containing protein